MEIADILITDSGLWIPSCVNKAGNNMRAIIDNNSTDQIAVCKFNNHPCVFSQLSRA